MFPTGTKVKSKRDEKIVGKIVGHGVIQWPDVDPNMSGDGWRLHNVYLVQVAIGSSSLGPACAVLRADQTEAVD